MFNLYNTYIDMKRFYLILMALFLGTAIHAGARPMNEGYTQHVNPWIGTGGHGHVFLGANVPFGFVQLGPTQPIRGWDWCSGYHYSDSVLTGFSHLHLSGTGIGDLGDVTLLPVVDESQDSTMFAHSDETVRPGYYAINLHRPEVRVELTTTQRAGFHRYTYASPKGRLMKINLRDGIGWDKLLTCSLKQTGTHAMEGSRISTGWAKHQQVYFVAEFSEAVEILSCNDNVFTIKIADSSRPLLVKVGLSAVSTANAKENLDHEISGWDFNAVADAATAAWNKQLGKIDVKTQDNTLKRIFYTALYHSMTAPSVFCDVNGEYRGSDGKVHHGQFTNYTTLSLWDTYRAAMPLMTLIHADRMSDMANTYLNIYRQQGKLPIWHLMGNETDCMVGNSGVIIMADLVLKGFVEDKEAAFQAMKASALRNERGLEQLKQYGYIPLDKDTTLETAAKTLEYAIADAGIAKVAKLLGHEDDYKYFFNRSKSYRKLFDPTDCFMKGVDSKGNFRTPFNPFHVIHRQDDYTEGNAWQYTWLVPHDVHGLVDLFGSEKRFTSKLDSLFHVTGDLGEDASPDISGLIGQYAHGNEPSHHIIYLYNYVGQPWKTAALSRQTLTTMYSDNPDGLSGNEDVGQMSAWYILSSLGLYQVDPANGKFVFGSPLFDSATLNVGNGKTFRIVAKNNSPQNMYIQQVKLNGKNYNKSYINYEQLRAGGTLEFKMGNKPSTFGTSKKSRP